jgi:predicted GIY-YIG superfamily endonuclease
MKRKPRGYWDIKENCRLEASKYKNRFEFEKATSTGYRVSKKNGWLDEFFGEPLVKSCGHWDNFDNCRKEASKYRTRISFKKGNQYAYNKARENGWLDQICDHMDVVGSMLMRCIYVFEFGDNYAYIGLTRDFNARYNEHTKDTNSAVYKHIEKTQLKPKHIQLTDYITKEEAKIKENEWEKKYKSNGWKVLNIAKTGGLGGGYLKWYYESCKKEASKYNSRHEFEKNCSAGYRISRENGWLDEFFGEPLRKVNNYWDNKEGCEKEALKYKNKWQFQKNSSSAYNTSYKNGWLDEFFPKNK